MEKRPLYSIGHGNRKPEDFTQLLKRFGIRYLVDVRSQPYSKLYPHFNQTELKFLLQKEGIQYVYMGDALGGRPIDSSCYTEDGKVNYEVLVRKDFFIQAINRLKVSFQKNIGLAIMCSESNPVECHRSKLIGRALSAERIPVQHIDERGWLKDQMLVIAEVNKGNGDIDLFGVTEYITSRKPYVRIPKTH